LKRLIIRNELKRTLEGFMVDGKGIRRSKRLKLTQKESEESPKCSETEKRRLKFQ
jgi:hypothetical protein